MPETTFTKSALNATKMLAISARLFSWSIFITNAVSLQRIKGKRMKLKPFLERYKKEMHIMNWQNPYIKPLLYFLQSPCTLIMPAKEEKRFSMSVFKNEWLAPTTRNTRNFVLNEHLKTKSKPKCTKTPPINSISFVVPNKIRDHWTKLLAKYSASKLACSRRSNCGVRCEVCFSCWLLFALSPLS